MSTQQTCVSCSTRFNIGAKTCSPCGTVQPYKVCAARRLEAFKAKSESWAEAIRRNRNMSHVRADSEVMVEKLKVIGMRPILLLGKYSKKREAWSAECPYDLPEQAKAILKRIEMLYKALLEGSAIERIW